MRAWGLKAVSLVLTASLFLGLFVNQAFAASESDFTVLTQTHVQPIPFFADYDGTSGAFDYSYTIPLPPGVNGHTPQLALVYNSLARTTVGQYDIAWRDTIPYITRSSRTGVEDLYTNPVFVSSLDGELVELTSTSYRPEVDEGSFRRYDQPNANTWEVTEKDGTVHTFASHQADPADSTRIYRWYLSTSTDANGNTIAYTYHSNQGQLYPETINYGPYTVTFARGSSTNARTSYSPGFLERTELRIESITVAHNGTVFATHDLTYTDDLLTSITPTTDVAKPAVVFEYAASNTSPSWTVASGFNAYNSNLFFADISGDGLPDLLQVHDDDGDHRIRVEENTGTGWQLLPYNGHGWLMNLPGVSGNGSGYITNANGAVPYLSYEEGFGEGRLVDVNGDGKTDYVEISDNDFEVYLSDGTQFVHSSTYSWTHGWTWEFGQFGDLNGDGLLDLIQIHENGDSNVSVQYFLNNGNGWSVGSNFNDWFVDLLADYGETQIARLDWYLSSENSSSAKYPSMALADMNADGLVDVVIRDYVNRVYLNTGTKWELAPQFDHDVDERIADYVDVDGNGYADVVVNYEPRNSTAIETHVFLNTGDDLVRSTAYETEIEAFPETLRGGGRYSPPGENINVLYHPNARDATFADINGDGQADFIDLEGTIQVYLSDGSPQNLLTAVTDPSDDTTTAITYQTSWEAGDNPDLPFAVPVIDSVTKTSGVVNTTESYSFSDGSYFIDPTDVFDRKFAGFGEVTKTTDLGKETTWYHQGNGNATSSGEMGDTEALMGRVYRTEITDLSDDLYRHTQTDYDTYDLGNSSTFIKRASQVTLDYDGDGDEKARATSYVYDNTNGSILSVTEHGEVNASSDGTWTDSGSDDRTTTFTYATSTDLVVPATETLTDSASVTLSETRYLYDGLALGSVTLGNLTSREGWISGSDYATETFTNDTSGNVLTETDGEGNVTTYTYDSYDLYPTSVTNDLSQTTTFAYDYRTGQVGTTTDPNGHVFVTTFDGFGRPISETIPDPQTGNPVIKTEWTYVDTPGAIAVTQTSHLTSSLTTDTVTYSDGFGNVIQERREGENDYAVRDFTYGDNGLLASESLPYFSAGAAKTSATTDSDLFSSYTYDPLGRVTLVSTVVGGTVTSYDQWQETVTDASGVDKDFTYDAFGRLVTVTEHEGSSTFDTDYEFDGLDNLTKITDADGNEREIGYDGLSRRTSLEDLHDPADSTFGTWSFSYDDASNLTSQTDPNNQTINWTYDDLNRQLTEDYTGAAGTEITYAYDSCANGVGQLCSAATPDVTTTFTFSENNLPASEARTIDSTTYSTSYEYDRQGNQTEMTYPDNSAVRYSYNAAGAVETVEEKETGGSYATLIADVDYGPHGKETYLERASGIASTYTFDEDELYRLRSIYTGFGTGNGGAELQAVEAELFATEVIEPVVPIVATEPTGETEEVEPPVVDETAEEDTPQTAASSTPEREDDTEPIATSTPLTIDPSAATATLEQASSTEVVATEISIDTEPIANARAERKKQLSDKDLVRHLNQLRADPAAVSQSVKQQIADRLRHVPKGSLTEQVQKLAPERRAAFRAEKSAGSRLSGRFIDKTTGLTIDVVEVEQTADEVAVYARAWRDGEQLGFGADGSVDIERFVIQNPPLLVSDPNGKHERVSVDEITDEVSVERFREDAKAALQQVVAEAAAMGGKTGTKIEQGKVGQTTYTFYPDAHAETHTVDGEIQTWDDNFNTAHDLSSANSWTIDDDNDINVQVSYRTGAYHWRIRRGVTSFKTDSIPSGHTIDSATVSVYLTHNLNTTLGGDTTDYLGLVQVKGDQMVSDTAVSTADFDQIGDAIDNPTLGAAKTYASTMTTGQYTDIALNATGLGWIARASEVKPAGATAGITYLGWRAGADIEDDTSDFSGTDLERQTYIFASADIAGTTQDPKLVVTTTPPGSGGGSGTTTASSTGGIQNLTYTYDSVGNITELVDASVTLSAVSTAYTYDDLNRLTTASTTVASSSPYSRTFSYDAIGNLTNKSDQGAYTYSGAGTANPHAATQIGSVTYTYDDNGNLTGNSAGLSNVWGYRNELISSTEGTDVTSFVYDHNGQRMKKTSPDSTVTYYPFGHYEVRDGEVSTHIYLGDRLIATREDGTLTDVHTDHLGSTRAVTDQTGEVSQILDYYPYGGIRIDDQSSTTNQGNRYTGHDYDEETDLNYMKARYQDGATARFLSQDPASLYLGRQDWGDSYGMELQMFLADPQLMNTYGYAKNNPMAYNDPTGELASRAGLSITSAGLTVTIRAVSAYLVANDLIQAIDIFVNPDQYSNEELQNAAVNSTYDLAGHAGSQLVPNHKISLVLDGLLVLQDSVDHLNGEGLTKEPPKSFIERNQELTAQFMEQRQLANEADGGSDEVDNSEEN